MIKISIDFYWPPKAESGILYSIRDKSTDVSNVDADSPQQSALHSENKS